MTTASNKEYELLTRYLLCELAALEQERVEGLYLFDERYADLLEEVETNLVDAYVENTLLPAQRLHFERHFMVTKNRREAVQTAYLLKVYRDRIAQPQAESVLAFRKPQKRHGWRIYAAAAAGAAFVVSLAIGAMLFFHLKRPTELASLTPPVSAVGSNSGSDKPPGTQALPSVPPVAPEASAPTPSGFSKSLPVSSGEKTPGLEHAGIMKDQGSPQPVAPALPPDVGSKPASAPPLRPPFVADTGLPSPSPVLPTFTQPKPEAPIVSAQATPYPPPFGPRNTTKRRIAVNAFDYSAVTASAKSLMGHDVNIGEGIRSMLMAKMAQSKTVVLLNRQKIQNVMREQDFGATNLAKQGTHAKISQLAGVDALLFGDVVVFGQDDTRNKNVAASARSGIARLGAINGRVASPQKAGNAEIVISLRLVDAETGEVIDSEEARGESSRAGANSGALGGSERGASDGRSMTSSSFGQTMIGEATQDAVNKIAAVLEEKMAGGTARSRTLEGRVAAVEGYQMTLTVGAQDGVQVGDRFQIGRITRTVVDSQTKEVLDWKTVKVGEFVVHQVRDRTAIGEYGGQPVDTAHTEEYIARLLP